MKEVVVVVAGLEVGGGGGRLVEAEKVSFEATSSLFRGCFSASLLDVAVDEYLTDTTETEWLMLCLLLLTDVVGVSLLDEFGDVVVVRGLQFLLFALLFDTIVFVVVLVGITEDGVIMVSLSSGLAFPVCGL